MEHLDEARAVLRDGGFIDAPTPWIDDTAKAIHEHGPYADYHGWERWLAREFPDLADELDEVDFRSKAWLYAAMSAACQRTAEMMGWKQVSR